MNKIFFRNRWWVIGFSLVLILGAGKTVQASGITEGLKATIDQVIGVWGEPVVERAAGAWTFLFFRNGCELACGTFDLVMFENDQAVDAVVRGRGHTYAGVSSSPANRLAEFTPPTGTVLDTTGLIG